MMHYHKISFGNCIIFYTGRIGERTPIPLCTMEYITLKVVNQQKWSTIFIYIYNITIYFCSIRAGSWNSTWTVTIKNSP